MDKNEALEQMVIFLDELGNKPSRFFKGLIDFNRAFTEDINKKRKITKQIKKLSDIYYKYNIAKQK